ncbi:hypothetical protein [Brachybacterium sp. YJGR34]|uniref:hypothetical protein n=1 Tax=Brachybacterium sp. YJGR34 TaxID=2059911 RepID=UPI000E0AEA6E|nr:hypothetical protein [Brachybacterium sp. YJGR34]
MSASPPPLEVHPGESATHHRIRDLLGRVTAALLAEQPALGVFAEHRPARDRSSGSTWRGAQTLCHVSPLLASTRAPEAGEDGAGRLLAAAEAVAARGGLHRRSEQVLQGVSSVSWTDAGGDLLEVVVGVRVAVRAISAPFAPEGPAAPRTVRPAGLTAR